MRHNEAKADEAKILSALVDSAWETGDHQGGGGRVGGQGAGASGGQPVQQELPLPENVHL